MPTRKKLIPLLSIAAVSALVLSACGQAPEDTTSTEGAGGGADAGDFTACMVSDEGGFDDKSFNQLAHDGLVQAETELGVNTLEAESTSPDDFTPNLQTMVDQSCNIIIPVGFMLADATQAVADANPETHFAIIDVDYLEGDNILQINYDTAQAAFLAGYASAGFSESGIVATYGGSQIPSVTIFMDGFADGVAYYNEQKGADVQVLGWNVESQTGEFVGNFTDNTKAKQITEGFLAQGADVILPVGGPLYQGAAEAIRADGDSAVLLGVDSDLTIGEPGYSDIIFVSILKGLDVTVFDAIENALNGTFAGGTIYTGTLENEGVGISGFGEFESQLPDGMLEELDTIKQQIISGEIVVESPSSPSQAE
ncbi:BMP family lipoprotein [Gulosibacter chungangensis]|uniref:BMP family ABC transporter substrate-binding protein n=1 Tax=Gulosibacter chungangensis TaxID=979746 RepID=A0A7J5BH89_9MICO|nr:BMP family ABC transporter substrate-binding protein [Gulosibacter chungangensis]KAB1644779.1 BMP family ABC transporter substrate-binding protein [Gulosibacter chungangensis]